MSQIINETKPNTVYVPSFADPHPDHLETAKLLAIALPASEFKGEILAYEVWQPIFANRLVNIESVWESKEKAILAHKSQLADRNYLSAISGLNRYRAGMFNVGKYAEAFFSVNKELYLKIAKENFKV